MMHRAAPVGSLPSSEDLAALRDRAWTEDRIEDPQGLPAGTIVRYEAGGRSIYIETHPAVWTPSPFTLGMCALVGEERCDGRKVLDFACGSGILGILAGLGGAAQVTFTDLNPQALVMARRNWALNGLDPAGASFIRSSCFEQMWDLPPAERRFDLIVSNPPTGIDTPEGLALRLSRALEVRATDWNSNGADGRLVTDALLADGYRFLAPGGSLLLVTTSKQGPRRTARLLCDGWGEGPTAPGDDPLDYVAAAPEPGRWEAWRVVKRIDLSLDDWYKPLVPRYVELAASRGEPAPVLAGADGALYQRLYFIRADNRSDL